MKSNQLPAEMNVSLSDKSLKICIVYSRSPFPMMRGDQLTIAHLIQFLSLRGHQISFFSNSVDGVMTEDQGAWLNESCKSVKFYELGKIKRIFNIALSILNLIPMQCGYFKNSSLERDVRKGIKNGEFDVVYVYYLRSAPVTSGLFHSMKSSLFNARTTVGFLAMQLSQTLNTYRIYVNEKNLLKKIIYYIEWRLLRRYEAKVWSDFTNTLLIGPKDVSAVKAACDDEKQPIIDNWLYGAHGTDINKFRPAAFEDMVKDRVVFSGSMLYQPNVQAVLWFVKECWEKIRKSRPDVELYIVGRDPVESIKSLNGSKGIVVTGTVEDVGHYIRTAQVCINPMLSAGGMQNKLIEYMASKKAVVASSIANEGIGASNKNQLLIADSSEEFVNAVIKLLDDTEYCEQLGWEAREFVLKNWTWESHFYQLEDNFLKALKL
jgi:glycosyltransferase involved in cell wall biosynthesis